MATSTKTRQRTATQLAADGFAALVEKLGMAEALRYVRLYQQGAGNYTRDRHKWLDEMSHDQIATLMARTKKPNRRKRKSRGTPPSGR